MTIKNQITNKMESSQKESLRRAMLAKIDRLEISQSSAAKMMVLSSATITNVKTGKWDNIKDAWRKIQQWVGFEGWQIVETNNVKGMMRIMKHAQEKSITKALSYRQGSGKSEAAKYYTSKTKNTFYLECEPHYTKKVFLQKLSQKMGLQLGSSISEMVDAIVDRLNKLEKPLVVLDEFDQLSDRVLPFFKTFYNKAHCGFFLIGGEYFQKRILKGVRLSKQSYCETFSRLGAEFIPLHPINSQMITAICEANGVYNKREISEIIKHANGDLRRVKNDVEKTLLSNQKK